MTVDELATIVMGEISWINFCMVGCLVMCVIMAFVIWRLYKRIYTQDHILAMMDEDLKTVYKRTYKINYKNGRA